MEYISKESVVSLIKMYGNNANDEQKFILADILSDINEFSVKEIEDRFVTKKMNEKKFGWVSVNDKLPPIGESVLVAVDINAKLNLPFRTNFEPEIRIGWFEENGEWGLQFDSADKDEILYWQPLPELPSKKMFGGEANETSTK